MMLTCCLLFLTTFIESAKVNSKASMDMLIQKMKNENYDLRLPPPPASANDTSGVVVSLNTIVERISNINLDAMTFDVQMRLRQEWVDPRLAYGQGAYEKLPHVMLADLNTVWVPDTYIQNEVHVHRHVFNKPEVLIVTDSGRVLFSQRVTVTVSCPMSIQSYPFDVQACQLDIASYAHPFDELSYRWDNLEDEQLSEDLRDVSGYFVKEIQFTNHTSRGHSRAHQTMSIDFIFARTSRYHVQRVLLPSAILVALSWVPLFLPRRCFTMRLSLAITPFFVITIQIFVVGCRLPTVPYVIAIEVWLAVCWLLSLATILESAVVAYLTERQIDLNAARNNIAKEAASFIKKKPNKPKRRDLSKLIDLISRALFPTIFLLFSVLFFVFYVL